MPDTTGLVKLSPSSFSFAGAGSVARLTRSGTLEFASCTSISVNGIFGSSYDNYLVTVDATSTASQATLRCRLRSSGSDNTSSSYHYHYYLITGSGHSGARFTSQTSWNVAEIDVRNISSARMYFFAPHLTIPTAFRSVSNSGNDGSRIYDYGCTHGQSVSYDGFTFDNLTFTGSMAFYGFTQ